MARLTNKQEAFIRAYIGPADFNGRLAAQIAGYAGDANTLSVVASENLAKPKIREEVSRRLDEQLPSNSALLFKLSRIAMGQHSEASARDERMAIRDLLELRGQFTTHIDITSAGESIEKMDSLFGLIRTDDHEGGNGA